MRDIVFGQDITTPFSIKLITFTVLSTVSVVLTMKISLLLTLHDFNAINTYINNSKAFKKTYINSQCFFRKMQTSIELFTNAKLFSGALMDCQSCYTFVSSCFIA